MRSRLKVLAGLLFGAACLWLAVRDASAHGMWTVVRAAETPWIIGAALLLALSYGARSVRWGTILGAADRESLPVLYSSTCLGYALNSVLPARGGDVARSVAAGRSLGLSTPKVLASTVVERVVDGLVLAAALAAVAPFVTALPSWLLDTAQLVGIVGVAVIAGLVLAVRRSSSERVAELEPRSSLRAAVLAFGAGLLLVDSVARSARVAAATFVVWAIDVCLIMALARAFQVSLGPLEGLALLAAFGLASAAPSTPGFVGVFQAIAVGVLVPFGASREAAIAIATALQLVTLVTATVGSMAGARAMRRASARRAAVTA